jgi:hypothetical protein
MSNKVLPLVALTQEAAGEPATLHLVPAGGQYCSECGVSKYRMRFNYTDEVSMFETLKQHTHPLQMIGMMDVSDASIKPYLLCQGAANASQEVN